MKSEVIKTFWRLGYFKLFDEKGALAVDSVVSIESGDWTKLFWRFYWRISHES